MRLFKWLIDLFIGLVADPYDNDPLFEDSSVINNKEIEK